MLYIVRYIRVVPYSQLVKVDVVNKKHVEWSEDNVYPSEPIFVPHPGAKVRASSFSILLCNNANNISIFEG